MSQQEVVVAHFEQNIQTSMYAQDMLGEQIEQAANYCTQVLMSENQKIFTCGMQLSEMVGQYLSAALLRREAGMKPALPSVNLNINSYMSMTSSTDAHSDTLRALANKQDVLIVFANDGDDPTILQTIQTAKELGLNVVCILGQQGHNLCQLLSNNDVEMRIPADDDAAVIEHQMIVANLLIKLIDSELFGF